MWLWIESFVDSFIEVRMLMRIPNANVECCQYIVMLFAPCLVRILIKRRRNTQTHSCDETEERKEMRMKRIGFIDQISYVAFCFFCLVKRRYAISNAFACVPKQKEATTTTTTAPTTATSKINEGVFD